MPVIRTDIGEFLRLSERMPVIDVRSPAEYQHAHMPGAHSLPLFTDDERRIIGTAYKQESRQKAVRIGLEVFGAKMLPLVDQAVSLIEKGKTLEVAVHCWRGGMRSGAVAWLLDLYGYKVYTLAGGYKAYRRDVLEQLAVRRNLRILGGYTGSNKTGVITRMISEGIPAIDLEALAGHRGSAFGNLNQHPQPGQEQFENLLAGELRKFDPEVPVWLEAESQRVGLINLPNAFFGQMRASTLYFLDLPFEKRLDHILSGYSAFSKEKIEQAIMRIQKKLGGVETRNAVDRLHKNDLRGCFSVLLKYYDRLYLRTTREPALPPGITAPLKRHTIQIKSDGTDAEHNLKKIMQHAR